MLAHRLRPAFRAASHVRAASTSSSASSAPTASRLTLGRLAVLGALAGGAAIALNAGAESRRVWNDGERLHNYDENLKVNRHKIAAQQGKTPETALNNSKATSSTHHVGKDATGGELKDGAVPGTDAGKGLPAAGSSSSGSGAPGLDDAAATQEQAGQEGAFNEETGEINWDCPCLGGMAHGPCGEQFRAAFSCFVFSEQEPKGIDCVDKFKLMQDCFREHPEQYGEEIDDDDDAAPVPTESNSPLSAPIVAKPLAADHPEADKIPKKPNAAPPPHSDIPRQTHLNNPAKGVQKLQPRKNRADKPEGAPPGDGSI